MSEALLSVLDAWRYSSKKSRASHVINLKIGIDTGVSLVRFATVRSDEVFVGIEIKDEKADVAARRIQRSGLSNAIVVCTEAQSFMENCPTEGCIDVIHVYFPTPNQRRLDIDHPPAQRRLLNARFFELASKALRLGGDIRIVTDEKSYIEFIHNIVDLGSWWSRPWDKFECGQMEPYLVGTKCEIDFRDEGREIYSALLQRIR